MSAASFLMRAAPAFLPGSAQDRAARAQRAATQALRVRNKPWLETVKILPGDTLYALSRASGVSLAQLERLNPELARSLTAGAALRLRTPSQAAEGARRAGRGAAPVAAQAIVPAGPRPALSKPAAPKPAAPTVRTIPSTAQGPSLPHPVTMSRGPVLGVPAVVVRIDLRDPRVRVTPLLPRSGLGTPGSFPSMARTPGVTSVINGGYFHPSTFSVTGDLVVGGRFLASGRVPTAIAITPDNRVQVYGPGRDGGRWTGFESVVANGPYVLRSGQVVIAPGAEGYRDAAVWGRASRSAIGVTSEKKLFFLSTTRKLSLGELARVMQKAGARDAIVLDGGSSTGIAWKGQVLIRPLRNIAYGVAVYARYNGARTGR